MPPHTSNLSHDIEFLSLNIFKIFLHIEDLQWTGHGFSVEYKLQYMAYVVYSYTLHSIEGKNLKNKPGT